MCLYMKTVIVVFTNFTSVLISTTAQSTANHRPDPVNEICDSFPVKIADLGNACWTVSANAGSEGHRFCSRAHWWIFFF